MKRKIDKESLIINIRKKSKNKKSKISSIFLRVQSQGQFEYYSKLNKTAIFKKFISPWKSFHFLEQIALL